jgi:hypothetical protein
MDQELSQRWEALKSAFESLQTCHRKWDITASRATDKLKERTSAEANVARSPIRLSEGEIPNVHSDRPALRFENANGPDLFLYPGFFMLLPENGLPGILNVQELQSLFDEAHFQEQEGVPQDGQVIGQTWFKANKDGSRDKRFKDNFQIPVVKYGHLTLRSSTGVQEVFMFSDFTKSEAFAKALDSYTSYFEAA